jgi:hypothetical protein
MPARLAQPALFPQCPMAGCRNMVGDPRHPCPDCTALFGPYLRPAESAVSAEEFTALTAAADARVAKVMAQRAAMPPAAAPAAAGPERRRNQLCWCCGQRRTCRRDTATRNGWICQDCEAIT